MYFLEGIFLPERYALEPTGLSYLARHMPGKMWGAGSGTDNHPPSLVGEGGRRVVRVRVPEKG